MCGFHIRFGFVERCQELQSSPLAFLPPRHGVMRGGFGARVPFPYSSENWVSKAAAQFGPRKGSFHRTFSAPEESKRRLPLMRYPL
jgi:hypothetical protein